MPHADGDDTAEEVQVLAPVHVPDVLHAAVVHGDCFGVVGGNCGEDEFLLLTIDLFAGHQRGCPFRRNRREDYEVGKRLSSHFLRLLPHISEYASVTRNRTPVESADVKFFRYLLLAFVLVMVALVSALTAMRYAIHGRE